MPAASWPASPVHVEESNFGFRCLCIGVPRNIGELTHIHIQIHINTYNTYIYIYMYMRGVRLGRP